MERLTPEGVLKRYRRAKERRRSWEAHWQECYDFSLPQRDGFQHRGAPGEKKTDHLFDGTAADAVDQLAASLLAELTPPWSRWFGLTAGFEISPEERGDLAPILDRAGTILQSHFDRSNFAIEMHQCYLDLVTGGTASLLFEEAGAGAPTAFRFTALPLSQVVLEEGPEGALDVTFRRSELTIPQIRARFPERPLSEAIARHERDDPEARLAVIEAVLPQEGRNGFRYLAMLEEGVGQGGAAGVGEILSEGRFETSPAINFRWLKAPGEIYGRSPVMKALPDIKTANKVVELVLKNASIAVTGIWQADDDGVLNPATVKLVPGAIIPKAMGSAGLRPLEAPGRFDVSQLVLEDLRKRIRHALLADKLGQADSPRMTATEVLERSTEMSRILGATYGRLQSELLTPLVMRALAILRRRGEIPDITVDGRLIDLQYRSPLAQQQARADVRNTMLWINATTAMGPEALATADLPAVARWIGRAFGVPGELIREESGTDTAGAIGDLADAIAIAGDGGAAPAGPAPEPDRVAPAASVASAASALAGAGAATPGGGDA